MKFVENICNISRIGSFVDVPARWNSLALKTPACLTYTRAGTVPHITYDILHHLDDDIGYTNLSLHPLPTIVDFRGSVKEFGQGLAKFVGLPNQPFHVSVQNPAQATPSGYNVKKSVAVWSHGGKVALTPKDFMASIKSFLPFSYQILCDSDTSNDSSNKRLTKSVDHSLNFLDQCLEEHSVSKELEETFVFGTIVGGYDIQLRKKSTQETAKRAVDGFVIDGFHTNGPDVRNLKFEDIKSILLEIISLLPPSKPRMLNGPFRPSFILSAVKCGIDLFDSSYPFLLTECGEALDLTFKLHKSENYDHIPSKIAKCTFELNINDPFYADRFSPIVKGCQCYTCTNFTVAYVHHLLVTSELLARVLLMIHNMYQFSKFFKSIREAVENNSFEKLERSFDFLHT